MSICPMLGAVTWSEGFCGVNGLMQEKNEKECAMIEGYPERCIYTKFGCSPSQPRRQLSPIEIESQISLNQPEVIKSYPRDLNLL
jgi:hypothetical protein